MLCHQAKTYRHLHPNGRYHPLCHHAKATLRPIYQRSTLARRTTRSIAAEALLTVRDGQAMRGIAAEALLMRRDGRAARSTTEALLTGCSTH